MIKVIFCVTLVCSALGQIQRLEPDLMTPLIRIAEYSQTESQISVSSFLEDSHFDAVSRAEQWLQDGLLGKDSIANVSSVCLNDTNTFLSALVDYEKWALRMIDAMGKPASGIMDGHLVWLGSYDECVAIEATVNISGAITHPYKGRYCKPSFKIGSGQPSPMNPTGVIALTVGVCVPNSCNGDDVSFLTHKLMGLLRINTKSFDILTPLTCQVDNLDYDAKAIVVIVICAVFGLIIVSATLYDVMMIVWLDKIRKQMAGYEVLDGPNEPVANHEVATNYGAIDSRQSEDSEVCQNGVQNSAIPPVILKHVVNQDPPSRGIGLRILLSFSVYSNAKKILSTNQPPGTLSAVHGIRFISMTWVILGHTYYFGLATAENLLTWAPEVLKRFTFQAITNATVSVDTFFTLSGLLVSYLTLKELKKRGGIRKFPWGMYYFHRFWRLTPPYMLFLMVYVPLIKYWSNGPLWSQTGIEKNECEDTWWKNILYINNLVDPLNQCMGWSWYLANDMQFYVVSPLMLIPLFYSSLLGTLSCGFFLLACLISIGTISASDNLGAGIMEAKDGFADVYLKPWCRIGPYVVGMFTGYILYKTDCKIKLNKLTNLFGWAIATTIALLVLYGLYDSSGTPHLSIGVSAFYNATHRSAWALAVCWVIVACATGYGGWVNTLLSWRALIPLSRLTYCAYLVHPVVMLVYYKSRRSLVYYSDMEMITIISLTTSTASIQSTLFCGFLCLSYGVAFIVSLAFESPMMGLEKVLLGKEKNS